MNHFPRTGVKQIDDEHRDITLLLLQIKKEKGNPAKIIEAFMGYVSTHFDRERAFMLTEGYPSADLQRHVEDHAHIRQIFLTDLMLGELNKDERLDAFRVAFGQHIAVFDQQLAAWIESCPSIIRHD